MKEMHRGGRDGLHERKERKKKNIKRRVWVLNCLALSPDMSQVHPVFHVSMLTKYISDPLHVLQTQSVELNKDLTFEEKPIAIVDYQVHQLRSKVIPMVKVLWRSNSVE